jgi:hypothetical protein
MFAEGIEIPIAVQQVIPILDAPVAITVSIVLRTVTPCQRSARKFFAAWTAISWPPNSTTVKEVSSCWT